ncbi:RES family NAD+ phosphorylase (plasmid) [Coraliomargarita sp. W4R53]
MSTIRGTFYRAIDPQFRKFAVAGSRAAGRYSRPDQPTLYLSSSIDGVEAAMVAHKDSRSASLEIASVDVDASAIVDLREPAVLDELGIEMADAIAPWQEVSASGGEPMSWGVRDRLVAAGAHGLIDPSRKRPGLWHLVLFQWNVAGAPIARLLGEHDPGNED